MTGKFTAALAEFALAFATLAPGVATARDRHGGYRGGYDGSYYHDGRDYRHYRHDDNSDAVAAGVIGLVLGLALGAAASAPRAPRYACTDNYQRCAAPPPPCGGCANQSYYNQDYAQPGYPNQGYNDRGYDPRYDNNDQGLEGGTYDPNDQQRSSCTRRERQWDRYANRYVIVDVPC